MIFEVAQEIASRKYDGGYAEFDEEVTKQLALENPVSEEEYNKADTNEITDRLAEAAMTTFTRKKEKMAQSAMPYIKEFVEERGASGIVGMPVTDGRRLFNIKGDINEAYENNCSNLTKAWEKAVLLSSIDNAWQEQLREMDELRKSVQNASYEQKDPLVIYKLEAYELWKKMLWDMNSKSVSTLMRGRLAVPDYEEAKARQEAQAAEQAQQQEEARRQQEMQRSYTRAMTNPYANYSTTRDTYPGESAQRQAAMNTNRGESSAAKQPKKAQPKIGRNDPCPCGSGKKYKNCCGRNQ